MGTPRRFRGFPQGVFGLRMPDPDEQDREGPYGLNLPANELLPGTGVGTGRRPCCALPPLLDSLGVMSQSRGGYVVLQRLPDGEWRVLGEADRQPGLPARKSRAQAIRDVLGREPTSDEVFAVLPRSEWRLALDS